jgi:hypothetical protein
VRYIKLFCVGLERIITAMEGIFREYYLGNQIKESEVGGTGIHKFSKV